MLQEVTVYGFRAAYLLEFPLCEADMEPSSPSFVSDGLVYLCDGSVLLQLRTVVQLAGYHHKTLHVVQQNVSARLIDNTGGSRDV